MIGDLVGFAAAATLRGIDFIQIPTTLLAQVDSAVGGKTGINSRHGKNLVGRLPPAAGGADRHRRARRPAGARAARRLRRGGQVRPDPRRRASSTGSRSTAPPAGRRPRGAARAIRRSLEVKAAIVAADERETTGERALLNFGHTFAHAYEALAGYDGGLLHGEAVAVGMVKAFALVGAAGPLPAGGRSSGRGRTSLRLGLPTRLAARQQPAVSRSTSCWPPWVGTRRSRTRGCGSSWRGGSATRSPARDVPEAAVARGAGRRMCEPLRRQPAQAVAADVPLDPGRRPAARRQRVLRRGRVRAGQGAGDPARGPGRGRQQAGAPRRSASSSHLEAYLAACQLGITMASLGLGWVGEPAVAAVLEPLFRLAGLGEPLLHTVAFAARLPALLLAAHRASASRCPRRFAIRQPEPIRSGSPRRCTRFFLLCWPLNWALNTAVARHPPAARGGRGQRPRGLSRRPSCAS